MTVSNMGSEGLKFFVGIVEDLTDPLQLGRVKVRIFAEHDNNINTEDLPWSIIIMPATSASAGSVGWSPTGLIVGSHVIGYYLDGEEKQFPAIMGTWHKIPNNDPNSHDVSPLARGTNSITKAKLGPEPDSAYASQYPHNKVYQTTSGHTIEVDDTPGQERLHIYHKSGTYTEINNDGRQVTKIVDDEYHIVVADRTIYVDGKANVHISNSENVFIGGDEDVVIHGHMDVNVQGRVTIRSGTGITLSAPGGVVVANGSLTVDHTAVVGSAATGTFTTPTGEIVHVLNGIITNIF